MRASGLHLVTDERLDFARLCEAVDAAVTAGTSVVQLRDKVVPARELVRRAVALSAVVAGRCAFIVNDRVDVAVAARREGARIDGVHLGQDDLDPPVARDLLGPAALIGWTADLPAHLAAAARFPAGTVDYLGVGVIRATGSKSDHPPVLGVDGFAALARATELPCVAIGGITSGDVRDLMAAGARGVAVVSAICAAADPGAAAREFVDRFAAAGSAS